MNSNFKFQISNSRGITLVELIVVIFIIVLFSSILIADFPKIQRNFALSRFSYKLAQDMRKTEDLGLSGVMATDEYKDPISIKGYGVYVYLDDTTKTATQYVIYADVTGDQKYSGGQFYNYCNTQVTADITSDCIIDVIDVGNDNSDLIIKGFTTGAGSASINFAPPTPIIAITPQSQEIGIILGLKSDNSASRTVFINTAGLIKVE